MRSTTDLRGEKIIDSRDVIARFDELESEQEELQSKVNEAQEAVNDAEGDVTLLMETLQEAKADLESWDNAEEYGALKGLIAEAEGYGDWAHGETLIQADYFEEYAQELAEDIGAIDRKAGWPLNHIDWSAAADELKSDYTEVEFDGTTYLMRS